MVIRIQVAQTNIQRESLDSVMQVNTRSSRVERDFQNVERFIVEKFLNGIRIFNKNSLDAIGPLRSTHLYRIIVRCRHTGKSRILSRFILRNLRSCLVR